jgi:predicted DNA-binding transcriptional regulator YafY
MSPDGMSKKAFRSRIVRFTTFVNAESFAREFGVSERTIARRIGRLQEVLGEQTRFQLGVQASRQGWLCVTTLAE